jgi:hypothetical protein
MNAATCASCSRSEWPAYRAILIQPLLERRAQGTMWVHWMLIAMMLGLAALAAAQSSKAVFVIGVGLHLGMLLLMWWVQYIGSIFTQIAPAAVQLTPRLRERALRVTVVLWVAIVIAMTLVVGAPTGYPGQVAVATGLVLIETAVMFTFWRLIAAGLVNWLLWHAGGAGPAWYGAFLASNAAVALGLLLVVLDGRAALRRMFFTPRRLPSSRAPERIMLPGHAKLTRIFKAIEGDSQFGQPLIARVLGPSAFGSGRLMFVFVVTACIAMRGWTALRGGGSPHDEMSVTRFVTLMALLVMQAIMVMGEMTSGYKRAAEQSLVRLAPAAPMAGDLNRVLARCRLLRFARMWVWMTALALGALAVLGASWEEVWRAAVVCTFTLGLAGLPLCDYARGGKTQAMTLVVVVPFMAAAGIGSLAALGAKGGADVWAYCAFASILLAALFVWRRWELIATAAPAFPAGRNH